MKTQKHSGAAHLIIVTIILAIGLVGAVGYVAWDKVVNNKQDTLSDIQEDDSSNNEDEKSTINEIDEDKKSSVNEIYNTKLGFIEGYLTYPSEGIPDSLVVYAINIKDQKKYKTSEHINDSKYRYGKGFKLEVPVGKYYVYGVIEEFNNQRKAYYNEYIECTHISPNDCESKDKTKKIVEVTEGKTTPQIVIGDWYHMSD